MKRLFRGILMACGVLFLAFIGLGILAGILGRPSDSSTDHAVIAPQQVEAPPKPAVPSPSPTSGIVLKVGGGANILVWTPGKMDEAMGLLNAGVEKTHPELLLVLLACRVPNGTTAIVTNGGFFSSDILVTDGRYTGCRGTIDNTFISRTP